MARPCISIGRACRRLCGPSLRGTRASRSPGRFPALRCCPSLPAGGFLTATSTWEHLGMTSGAPQGGTPQAGAASKGGAPPWCVGPSLPHFIIPFTHSLLSPEKTRTHFLSLAFLLKNSRFLDLFAQPRFLSEIWHICSLVCDSFDCPIRILFG